MRLIRYLTATSTVFLTALLTLVLLFYSLSVALGAEECNRTVERESIAEAVPNLQRGASMDLLTAAPARCIHLRLRPEGGYSSEDRRVNVCHFKTSGIHDYPE
jgi:hypothetical protein